MNMCADKPRPTTDELFELLRRTSLPTVLVEGKDDIIFYRKMEDELRNYSIDILPAGNKSAVLELRGRLEGVGLNVPLVFIVDKDLWVHTDEQHAGSNLISTCGYSIENDLYSDGDLESLLSDAEKSLYKAELDRFISWYALCVHRFLSGTPSAFRSHPSRVLDDDVFYSSCLKLHSNEIYPLEFKTEICGSYSMLLRGKSLLALLQRRLSSEARDVKFSTKQLIAFGASRKGPNFQRICNDIEKSILEQTRH